MTNKLQKGGKINIKNRLVIMPPNSNNH